MPIIDGPHEPRAPFGDDSLELRVARRAFERFLERGGAHGFDQEDWFAAERELTTAGPEKAGTNVADPSADTPEENTFGA